MTPERPAFSNLPHELVEEILIACVANNDVASVAAVAATSHRLYSIVYHTTDHHLWRSLFLTLFDDPRELDRRPALGVQSPFVCSLARPKTLTYGMR